MRVLAALLLLTSQAAHADLYRWVDPQSGSVKFSSVPPPPTQPGVEVVPYRGGSAATKPAPSAAARLERRWHVLLGEIAQSTQSPAESAALQQQLRELAETSAELDRVDPGGASRRRAEAERALQQLLKEHP